MHATLTESVKEAADMHANFIALACKKLACLCARVFNGGLNVSYTSTEKEICSMHVNF